MPTPLDDYRPERWVGAAVFFPESRAAYRRLLDQPWTDALRVTHPAEAINAYWDYFRNAYDRNAGLRMDHLLLSPDSRRDSWPPASTGTCAAGKSPAIPPRLGLSSEMGSS